ncbi:MAG: sugar kinase [Candidatus Omnitrophica bacterium]|nr:sugar kinase [Candidatus Omnitrophota bacterium]
MSMKIDVICLGILCADVVAKPVKKIPGRGKLELVDRIELHSGGCASNTGVCLARLGIKTALAGKVGRDGFGDFLIDTFKREGMETAGIKKDSKANTSVTMVMVDEGAERSFIHYVGANGTLREEDIDLGLFPDAKILHMAGFYLMPGFDGEPASRILKKARESGLTTSLDTCWDSKGRWLDLISPCLEFTDIFLPSIEEAKKITGMEEPEKICRFFLKKGVKIVGLKMGEEGAFIASVDQSFPLPPFKVNVVDTTGAGDAFVAGFLTGRILYKDLLETGKLACAAGAAAVSAMGATDGVKSIEQVKGLMES